MLLAPQDSRTFFISSSTWGRRSILQSRPLCDLLLSVIRENRAKERLLVHEFVFMRDHVHVILTPGPDVSLEKAVQFIKGGFSFRAKKEKLFNGEIWEKGYNERRIKDAHEYATHVDYVWMNPVRAGLVERPEDFLYSSARLKEEVDPAPRQYQGIPAAKADSIGAPFPLD
ncbi:MAG TPA: transposase [Candidatus Acidoferrales bacterium]|nr:transposase [Candidatus Acidoferrales bacterium]